MLNTSHILIVLHLYGIELFIYGLLEPAISTSRISADGFKSVKDIMESKYVEIFKYPNHNITNKISKTKISSEKYSMINYNRNNNSKILYEK